MQRPAGRVKAALALALASVLLAGCAGIAKGVTEAVLEQRAAPDARACEVTGAPFQGIEAAMRAQAETSPGPGARRPAVKVLMVHGIGEHLPGYSGALLDNLSAALGLDAIDESVKDIELQTTAGPDGAPRRVANLRVKRLLDPDRGRELLFYELSWSELIADEKRTLSFDDTAEHAAKRADFNRTFKSFLNARVPDVLIYLGETQTEIREAVGRSTCWMLSKEWHELPVAGGGDCAYDAATLAAGLQGSEIVYITHSLGSRILIDHLQTFLTRETADDDAPGTRSDEPRLRLDRDRDRVFFDALKPKNITVFMLANQLPLLQLGRAAPAVTGQIDRYCRADGDLYRDRLLDQLNIVAFSDPNDILSYPVPPKFVRERMDSRLCPTVVNVEINVAKVINLLGLGEFANPAEAHGGYERDGRVIGLIAGGIGQPDSSPLVAERCNWRRVVRD